LLGRHLPGVDRLEVCLFVRLAELMLDRPQRRPPDSELQLAGCRGSARGVARRSEAVWHVCGVHPEGERGCEPEVEQADQ
jgi:hypothetical protein